MRILSEHQIHDPEAFFRSANAALIKGLPKFRLQEKHTVASRAYFVWEGPSEQELREFIEREFGATGVSLLRMVPERWHPLRPRITGVFPFSIIRPSGGVIVQGINFFASAGQFLLLLSESGTKYELTNLQWANTSVAGVIPWDIAGVPDQPAFLQVIRPDGFMSNEWPVQFTAARVPALLPGTALTPVQCGSGGDDFCYTGSDTDHFTVAGAHAMSLGLYSANGTDVWNCNLKNGWVFDHYQWGANNGINGGPFGQAPDPVGLAEFTLAISWGFGWFGSSNYELSVFVVGPAGMPFN